MRRKEVGEENINVPKRIERLTELEKWGIIAEGPANNIYDFEDCKE
jgi:hypothetical protein